MLLYTTCKPFKGHDGLIQRNALRSWARLPGTRLLLIGADEGTEDMAHEIGAGRNQQVIWLPYLGVPLVRDLWRLAKEHAAPGEILCYANADMILLPELVEAANKAAAWQREFLLVGQRYALNVYEELDFDSDWRGQLQGWHKAEGGMGVECQVDYFCWRGDFWGEIPDFKIGRYRWDNWLVWRAISAPTFVCDVTAVVPAYHQSHHQLPWEHPEGVANRAMASGNPGAGIKDVKWKLEAGGFREKKS